MAHQYCKGQRRVEVCGRQAIPEVDHHDQRCPDQQRREPAMGGNRNAEHEHQDEVADGFYRGSHGGPFGRCGAIVGVELYYRHGG